MLIFDTPLSTLLPLRRRFISLIFSATDYACRHYASMYTRRRRLRFSLDASPLLFLVGTWRGKVDNNIVSRYTYLLTSYTTSHYRRLLLFFCCR